MEIQLQLVRLSFWLGGLLPKAEYTKSGFNYELFFNISNDKNLDDYTKNGKGLILVNHPKFKNGGFIQVIETAGYILQDVIDLSSKKRKYRIRLSNMDWSDWLIAST